MPTATAATWPTEASLEVAGKALSKAFNEVEAVVNSLDQLIGPWMDEGKRPDLPPTLETVGTAYSFLETLDTEIAQLKMEAESLKQQVREIDAMRLDIASADDAR